MGEVAEIIKTTYEILRGNSSVPIVVDSRNLGMAYAIPNGTETTVAENYSPWHDAQFRQVFYRESSGFHEVLAEVEMIMSWRHSEAQQYIINVNLDKSVIQIDPLTSVSISVRFDQPTLYDIVLEAYEIPFTVTVDFRPVGTSATVIYRGRVRADGSGEFAET